MKHGVCRLVEFLQQCSVDNRYGTIDYSIYTGGSVIRISVSSYAIVNKIMREFNYVPCDFSSKKKNTFTYDKRSFAFADVIEYLNQHLTGQREFYTYTFGGIKVHAPLSVYVETVQMNMVDEVYRVSGRVPVVISCNDGKPFFLGVEYVV